MKLCDIKGIGERTEQLLEKLRIFSAEDLISYYPFRFEVIKQTGLENPIDGKVIVDGTIETTPYLSYFGGNQNRLSFKFNTKNQLVSLVMFNRAFLKPALFVGKDITVAGKYDAEKNNLVATDVYYELLGKETWIIPIYHVTKGITTKVIKKLISEALTKELEVPDIIPQVFIDKYQFIDKRKALLTVHNPKNLATLNNAIKRLKYEELFLFMLKINVLKQRNIEEGEKLIRTIDEQEPKKFIDQLPFKLTTDQQKTIDDIINDFKSPKRMNRLIQGDVGSGKTIVSVIAMYLNYLNGYQSALMAPTEILAKQHYETLVDLLYDYNIHVELLLGSTRTIEKKAIYNKLETGQIDIIVGTHALIQEKVKYNNLGLVVTDEQQRFGVNQRANLKNKGIRPDVLYLSATPIPRTYALTIYGDMDVSNIHSAISGRKEIKTYLKSPSEIRKVLLLMKRELDLGHQVYVVAPLIEKNDEIDLENIEELEENLTRAFGKDYPIGVLNGKMKALKKESVMKDFQDKEIRILISTTVIEVGIDVKDATIMVIYDAERFGLSQLHQLRGRVGRNELQSYCILISDQEKERLEIMTKTTDGFKISEEDFRLRGEGNLFGVKQSGDMEFNLADIKKDFNLLLHAKEDAKEVFEKGITHYPEINPKIIELSQLD